jgi:hypothetical protein
MTTNVSPAVLQPGAVLTASPLAYVTGQANSQVIIKRAVFTNTTSGAVTFTVYRVPSSGTPATGEIIISARSIAANGTDLAPELSNMVLNAGDTIQAEASAATSINMFASGFVAN